MSIQITKRPYNYCWSGNPVRYELYSAAAAADSTIYFEVKLHFKFIGDIGFTDLVTLPFYPVAGKASVNLQDLLDSKLEYELPKFDNDETLPWAAPKQTGQYYISVREIALTSSDPAWDDSEEDYKRIVVKGGITYFKWRGNNFWSQYFNVQLPFLTWQVNGRMAALTERMYLAWLNYLDVDPNDLKARTSIVYTDGSVVASAALIVLSNSTKNIVEFIPTGAGQLGLVAVTPDKKIWYWEVQVLDYTDPDNPVPASEAFRYYADNRKNYNDTTIHYRGSLGGLDSARVRGVIEQALEYTGDSEARTTSDDYFDNHYITAQKIVSNNKEQMGWKGDIGHLEKEEQDRLRDLHLQREMWWEVERKWWPILDTTGTIKLRSSEKTRWSLPFEWTLANSGDKYYTPKNVSLGDSVSEDNICLALMSLIDVTVDVSGPDAEVILNATEVDPDNASTQFTYQIIGVDADPIVANVGDLPITRHIPKDIVYIVKFRSICNNGVYGGYTDAQIDTTVSGGGPGANNSTVFNFMHVPQNLTIDVDGITQFMGYVGVFGHGFFDVPNGGPYTVEVTLDSIEPSYAELETNGVTYIGVITGFTVTFSGINAVGGVEIRLY